jgi:hypothetical protein
VSEVVGGGFETSTAFNDVRQMSISKGVSSYHGVYSFVFVCDYTKV